MIFSDAKDKLKEMADGQYCSIEYDLELHKDGEEVPSCGVYIHGYASAKAPTWEEAFAKLDCQINGLPKPTNTEQEPV